MSESNSNSNINQSINQITLDCLLNKEIYNKCVNATELKKDNLKEMKFYRKRIYDLVKRLLTSKEERDNLNPDVNYAFNNFVKSAITYFKMLDKGDILQKDYENFIEKQDTNDNDNDNDNDNNNDNDNDNDNDNNDMLNCDKYIMKQVKIPQEPNKMTTLDNFIIRKESNVTEETFIYPQTREFNLNDISLKNKGIKQKKPKNKDKKEKEK